MTGESGMRARWQRALRRVWLAVFAFSARSLQQITTFVLTLLAARFLAPAEYGVYTLSILFVTFLQTLIYTGFFHYVVRAKGDEKQVVDTCFWLILGLSGLGSLALFAGAPALARLFDAPDMVLVLRLLATIQPAVAVTAWCSSVLMRQNRMKLHFNIMIAQNLISLVAGVAILVIWQSVFALVAYRVARAFSGALMYFYFSKVRPGLSATWATVRDAMKFSYGLYGTSILNFFSNYGADLALGLLFSTAEAGLYRFGNRIAMGAMDIIGQPMRSFAITQLGAANRNDEPFGPILKRFASTTLILMGCVAGTLLVFGEEVVTMYFQPAYVGGLVVAYAIAMRALFGLGNYFVEPVLASSGQTNLVLAHNGTWTLIQTAAIPLAAGFGLAVLAWTGAVLALFSSFTGFWLISRYGGVEIRPVLIGMLKASVIVIAYVVVAGLVHDVVLGEIGAGNLALFVSLGLSGLLGLGLLFIAAYQRTLDLRVFSG